MKRIFTRAALLCLALLLSACSVFQKPSALPAPERKCKGEVCINQVFLTLSGDQMLVQFDMTDRDGEVSAGANLRITTGLRIGLFLTSSDEDMFLYGGQVPNELIDCYTSNDLPWAEGNLAAVCNVLFSVSEMEAIPVSGIVIRVQELEFGFEQTVLLAAGR